MTGVRRAFGAWGEQTAEAYLRGLGMVVIDRNWRCPQGELDLVALDGDVIVFCEQKLQDLRQADFQDDQASDDGPSGSGTSSSGQVLREHRLILHGHQYSQDQPEKTARGDVEVVG